MPSESRSKAASRPLPSDPDAPIDSLHIIHATPANSEAHNLPLEVESCLQHDKRAKTAKRDATLEEVQTLKEGRGLQVAKWKFELVNQDLDAYKRLFDPLRIIPVKILQKIFAYWVENSPWKLASVCSKWRAAAVGCAALWSSVDVDLGRLVIRRQPQHATHLLSMQLTRSGSAPLDVKIRGIGLLTEMHPVLPLLTMSANHWHTLVMDVDGGDIAALMPIQPYLQALEVLDLTMETYPTQWKSSGYMEKGLFIHATGLKSLTLRTYAARYTSDFNLRQLSFLSVPINRFVSLHHSDALIPYDSHLSTLELLVDWPLSSTVSLEYSTIAHLTIRLCGIAVMSVLEWVGDITEALNNVSMPNLEELSIISSSSSESLKSLQRFLNHSGRQLRRLRLDLPKSTSVDGPSIVALVKPCEALNTLNLRLRSRSEERLVMFTVRAEDTLGKKMRNGSLTVVLSSLEVEWEKGGLREWRMRVQNV